MIRFQAAEIIDSIADITGNASNPTASASPCRQQISWRFWIVLTLSIASWVVLMYLPTRLRNETLESGIIDERNHLQIHSIHKRRMQARLKRLRENDPYLLEAAARENMNWVRPGESTSTLQ